MLRRNGSGRLSQGSRRVEEDINPMAAVANLVDAMLVLAVGIMLALIVSWNLNISEAGQVKEKVTKDDAAMDFTKDDIDETTQQGQNLEEQGTVYYDSETGKYYVVPNSK